MVKIAIIGCGLMGIKIAGLCLIIQSVIRIGKSLELEHPRKTAKIPQIFSDFYYE